MSKPCKAEGCYRQRWGGGFCFYHQKLRDDKKPKATTSYAKKPQDIQISFGFDNQLEMFHALWDNAKDVNGIVVCPFTGERLNRFYGTDMWYSCFAHVLNKKNWTYFKLNPDNICVVFPEFHRIVDSGTFKQRSEHPEWKWSAWDSKVFEMKGKYAQFKRENLLA